jgi:murein DD-endopeptidase MepM/ murein hydrolase activator NlpD
MGICRSEDLRFRVVELVAAGSSRRAAAERFAVSVSSAIRWSARAKSEGSPKPRKQGRPAGKGPLVAHLDYLIAVVEAAPDRGGRVSLNSDWRRISGSSAGCFLDLPIWGVMQGGRLAHHLSRSL